MSEITREQVEAALKEYQDPYLEGDLVSRKAVKDIQVDGGAVAVTIELGFPNSGYRDGLTATLKERVEALDGVREARVQVETRLTSHAVQKGLKPIKGIKNIIAVASGKGGVPGKPNPLGSRHGP